MDSEKYIIKIDILGKEININVTLPIDLTNEEREDLILGKVIQTLITFVKINEVIKNDRPWPLRSNSNHCRKYP